MNTLITRMAGVRQGMGLAIGIVIIVYFAQGFFAPGQRSIPFALPQLMFGAGFIVWSIEEHLRGNKLFTVVFLALGLLSFGYSAYLLFR